MNEPDVKRAIEAALKKFANRPPAEAAINLFEALGYTSPKKLKLSPNNLDTFKATFAQGKTLNGKYALPGEWKSIDFLFQLTDDEIRAGGTRQISFESKGVYNGAVINSYLFFALELKGSRYTRTQLAGITREINKLFAMPALVLFRHGETLTLAIIPRRLHRREEGKDVLEKVTLIQDIGCDHTHRAHIEILFDLSLDALHRKHGFSNFVELQAAWQKTLDTSALNKRFYQELANWYFWALDQVSFPDDIEKNKDVRNATSLIRLITRITFIWFIKEKDLVPERLFDRRELDRVLKGFFKSNQSHSYYQAILQNLFFGTLNQKMTERGFAREGTFSENRQNYGVKTLFRYGDLFAVSEKEAMALFEDIPFLNGGLFDCLDKENDEGKVLYADGFSREPKKQAFVPDFLFFGGEVDYDLNQTYGTKNKKYKVKGLFEILSSYKFTITENTPIEEEIALDPELLGKVFENLLAAYNPETGATARKQTGSFYTPREIVNYMVDESLKAWLKQKLEAEAVMKPEDAEIGLAFLIGYNEKEHLFDEKQMAVLISAIDTCKILDPACGSGAFPMGVLHKMVHILHKLDPDNQKWREVQRQKAIKETEQAFRIGNKQEREDRLKEISDVFEYNSDDYGRKLYLIENCIYGVDIQPIAIQISKLRFFISLIVDQKTDPARENLGIRSLPNLETKFVAANTLIGLEKPKLGSESKPATAQKSRRVTKANQASTFKLENLEIVGLKAELKELRHQYFSARTRREKLDCQKKDKTLRKQISALLVQDGWGSASAKQVADFDPYDQNASAGFFDAEWMFGISSPQVPSPAGGQEGGFDVVIANPPYVRQEQIKEMKPALQEQFSCYTGVADLYVYFYERGFQLLNENGVLTFISSNKYFRSGYGEKLRQFLASKATVHQLIDFGDAPVFDAIAYPSIIILSRRAPNANHARVLNWEPGPPIEEFEFVFASRSILMAQKELASDGWRLESPAVLRLLEKLRKAGKPLGEYVNGRFYRGILTGFNEAFVVDRATRDRLIAEHPSSAEVLKPFLRGRDVKRWRVDFGEQYLIKIESSQNRQHPWSGKIQKNAEKVFALTFPAVHARFEEFREKLMKRDDQGEYFWELRSCVYWQEFEQPKIVIPSITHGVEYAPDFAGYYSNDKTSICVTDSVSYLLGLLNSKTLWWFIRQTAATKQGGFFEFKPMYISKVPIPQCADPKPIETLVGQILAIKGKDLAADVSALEREIDERVYRLYGLTAEEIGVVEGK